MAKPVLFLGYKNMVGLILLEFTSDGRQDKELNTKKDKARAVIQALRNSVHDTRIVEKGKALK